MTVLIVDDENPARNLIKSLIGNNVDIEIIGEASNGFEALKIINEKRPDLIFLDIQMPKINGFELLELLEDPPFVIFTTAYSEYAIKAFEMNAIDYLLKPMQEDRLKMALDKALGFKMKKPDLTEINNQRFSPENTIERIVVKTGNQIHIIPVDEIDRIEADDDYVRIYSSNKFYLKKMTLKYLEEKLSQKQFIRIHRSYILNIDNLQKLESMGKESYVAVLKNGDKLPVSARGYQLLKSQMGF